MSINYGFSLRVPASLVLISFLNFTNAVKDDGAPPPTGPPYNLDQRVSWLLRHNYLAFKIIERH
ncbi:hypothetical protein CC1G_14176 [Coprinopsis cinerea okayama7|uniref:Uncharacterized protein n=1 Tax=Coprinopsis cinerea (strain Okayama-7 / 130 / ATCC MYA-4618 / FGSC 9003) TaxID=240176 RepID=D6RL77_COPC7|nr:hypothetical protein CC1G_14176 [Coprinopsis cinerea okayama7\|eukprot:XP_002911643.1 hypothetical protein CC1G_14176 [Coprinopsis cinerea okayama7\